MEIRHTGSQPKEFPPHHTSQNRSTLDGVSWTMLPSEIRKHGNVFDQEVG